MPRSPVQIPAKSCERCGETFERKRFNSAWEDMTRFRSRKYCSLRCANSRGIRSKSSGSQHRISLKWRKECCESCGTRPENLKHLHVHHINEDWMDHRPENLKTLCVGCHLKLHPASVRKPCLHCSTLARRNGMCQKHWQRFKKYGDATLTKVRTTGYPATFVLVRESSLHRADSRSQVRKPSKPSPEAPSGPDC